jgi:hypothetical protein
VAHVKPGGHWWDVYKALANTGWTVIGGRLGTIGVGGFLLQGGVSFLSGEHGLASDVSSLASSTHTTDKTTRIFLSTKLYWQMVQSPISTRKLIPVL